MKFNIETLIKDIHNSDLYFYISEIGAGLPLSSKLFSVEGSSNSIFKADSNYSIESQNIYNSKHRSVSLERIKSMLEYTESISNLPNSFVCNSFQIGPGLCNHGWVAIKLKNKLNYFHFTFPEMERSFLINLISNSLIKLIHKLYINTIEIENIPYLDGMFSETLEFDYSIFDLGIDHNAIICFDESGKWKRFESLYRDNQINYFMGSFNPLHEGHSYIYNHSENSTLALTINNFEKSSLSKDEIINRVGNFENHRYLITKNSLLTDNLNLLKSRHPDKNTVSMGFDTYKRVEPYIFDEHLDVTFKIFDRENKIKSFISTKYNLIFLKNEKYKNISSTKIRNNVSN